MHVPAVLHPLLVPSGLVALLTALFVGAAPLGARTIHVDQRATGSGDGGSWTDACRELQGAILAAASGDEIWVAEGTYHPDEGTGQTANHRGSTFTLRNGVAIYGGFAGTETLRTDRHPARHPTILSGDLLQNDGGSGTTLDNAYHVVTGSGTDASAVLDGFHIRAGHANAFNAPDNGGGGLVCNGSGSPTLVNCAFSGNRASDLGGAVSCNASSHPSFTNCSFSGNHVSIIGGAVCSTNSSYPFFTNCTFAGNTASGLSAFGGALYSSPSSMSTLVNCILWDNRATTGGDQIEGPPGHASSHNLVGGGTLGGHVISVSDPHFTRNPAPGADGVWTGPADNDYGDLRLQPASPARNLGLNAANTSPLDLAANSRLQNGSIDLGAYELPFIQTVTNVNDSGPGSLREAIATILPPGGGTIVFDLAIDGQVIALGSGPLRVDKTLTIDASALPTGLTVDARQTARVFEITAGADVVFHTFTITGGMTADGSHGADGANQPGGTGGTGQPGSPSGDGGGILNEGRLTLTRVTLTGNRTGSGGSGGNGGSGTLPGPAGAGAASGHGGGIHNSGELIIINSTIAGNHTGSGGDAGSGEGSPGAGPGGDGGGIHNTGTLTLVHATITDNSTGATGFGTPPSPGSGGGVKQLGQVSMHNSIIAQNLATSGGSDLDGDAGPAWGLNFVGDPAGASGLGPHLLTGDPLLSPLGANGGPTATRSPSFDSPAVDPVHGATTSRLPTDQRGVSRVVGGVVDIGAVEALLSAVVTSLADSGTGSLRDSILGVETGGVITFAPGLDGGVITLSGGELAITRSLTIDAAALPSGITIDANRASRAFSIDDANDLVLRDVVLSNLTIAGGSTPGNGGGIASRENLVLRDCTLDGNLAVGHGGGVWLAGGSSLMERCAVTGNSAAGTGGGGGIRLDSGASLALVHTAFRANTATSTAFGSRGGGSLAALAGSHLSASACTFHSEMSGSVGGAMSVDTDSATVSGCVFSRNAAGRGGAVHLLSASPAFVACRFVENHASAAGGAFCMAAASGPVISNCVFTGNSAERGGASHCTGSGPSFTNCLFPGNHATVSGGAAYNSSSPDAAFTNCTFSENTAPTGGAIHNDASAPTLTHCILWGNSASVADPQVSGAVSPASSANLVQDGTGPHVILATNPRFADHPGPGPDGSWTGLDDNNYGNLRLLADSPAIGAGSNAAYDAASTISTDIIGKPRQVGAIDLGAYEGSYLNFSLMFPLLDPEGDANGNGASNFIDYASGVDPTAPFDARVVPAMTGTRLMFSYRPDPAVDTFPSFQRSPDLVNWETMVEGVDYAVIGTTTTGTRTRITLDLLNPAAQPPEVYFRERFSIAP